MWNYLHFLSMTSLRRIERIDKILDNLKRIWFIFNLFSLAILIKLKHIIIISFELIIYCNFKYKKSKYSFNKVIFFSSFKSSISFNSSQVQLKNIWKDYLVDVLSKFWLHRWVKSFIFKKEKDWFIYTKRFFLLLS